MKPSRGEVWLVDLNPTAGHERGGTRPALVLSVDRFNHGPAGLVIVMPLTTKNKGIKSHIAIHPPQGGCDQDSYIKTEEIRCISTERLIKLKGAVDVKVMAEVSYSLQVLLGM